MITIGLLSDTHGYLHPDVFNYFGNVDEIWHAGDFGSYNLIQELKDFKPLKGVYGNIDGQEIRNEFPEVLFFETEGLKVAIKHIGGYPPNYNINTKPWLYSAKPNLFISGHSHILKVLKDDKLNCLHLNPGACGKQGWHKVKTLMRFQIALGVINKLEVIELP